MATHSEPPHSLPRFLHLASLRFRRFSPSSLDPHFSNLSLLLDCLHSAIVLLQGGFCLEASPNLVAFLSDLESDVFPALGSLEDEMGFNRLWQLHILRTLLYCTSRVRMLLLRLLCTHSSSDLVSSRMDVEQHVGSRVFGLFDSPAASLQRQRDNEGLGRAESDDETQFVERIFKASLSFCANCLSDKFSITGIFSGIVERYVPLSVSSEHNSTENQEVTIRFAEALTVAEKNLELLQVSLEDVNVIISRTMQTLKATLLSSQSRPSFTTNAFLRDILHSFLDLNNNGELSSYNEWVSRPGDYALGVTVIENVFLRNAQELIGKLQDPQGPSVVWISGVKGIGKTCLASYIANDHCISRHFPGGVYWVYVGRDPDLIFLQRLLWEKITGSTIYFNSTDEGRTTLTKCFLEFLPFLLVLDDVWDKSDVSAFMCFDGKDRGRILVTTRSTDAPTLDSYLHVLSSMKTDEAFSIFCSVAAWKTQLSPGLVKIVHTLARNCGGIPWAIQAIASVFYRDQDVLMLPFVQELTRYKTFFPQCPLHLENIHIVDLGIGCDNKLLTSGENLQPWSHDLDVCFAWLHSCFNALSIIHPSLSECFLDLAAFPEGEWVTLSALKDIWGVGDGMDEAEIVLVLSFLASRGMLEFRVDTGVEDGEGLNCWNKEGKLLWKLVDGFYTLAKRIVQIELESSGTYSRLLKNQLKGSEVNGHRINRVKLKGLPGHGCSKSQEQGASNDGLMVDVNKEDKSHLQGQEIRAEGIGCILTAIQDKEGDNHAFHKAEHKGLESLSHRSAWTHHTKRGLRLFITGIKSEQYPDIWVNEQVATAASKLSAIGSGIVRLPSAVSFPHLRVALLSNNESLKCISTAAIRAMPHLAVLDLKKCTLLTWLPKSISTLQSLELLDLSSCIHLFSLPPSIGKLRRLRFLLLSGCISLRYLPKSLGQLYRLEILDLNMCVRLRMLPVSLGHLSSLRVLKLYGCYSLQSLPTSMILLRNLKILELSGCSNLSYTLPCLHQLKVFFQLQRFAPLAVPTGLWKLREIEVLNLASLKNLTYLPFICGNLQHLCHLNLSSCRSLESLPADIDSLFLLQTLNLSHTAIRNLPDSLGQLRSLVVLCLQGCSRLLCIPSSISLLPKLEVLDFSECWDLIILPDSLGKPNSLPELLDLNMAGCSIQQLPYFCSGALPRVRKLNISNCQSLMSIPSSLGMLKCLESINFDGCKALTSLQDAGFGDLKKLSWLSLRNCISLRSLPVSELLSLGSLRLLDVSGCSGLSPFPEPLLSCAREQRFTLVRWGAVWP